MAGAREVRRRIKTVKNIQQITRAMKMVAAARLRRAQEQALQSKPYLEKLRELLAHAIAGMEGNIDHPLAETREIKKTGYIVFTSDKGLAGAYNSNIIKEAVRQIKGQGQDAILAVGRKGRDYFKRRNYDVAGEYTGCSDKPAFQDAKAIARDVTGRYMRGEIDELYIVYTQFLSPIHHQPTTIRLLPVSGLEDELGEMKAEATLEPSAEAVLNELLPQYLEMLIYGALMQSSASEHGARMAAMGSATDNAQELITKLVLDYNKIRQAGITREISEIVGGAEALT